MGARVRPAGWLLLAAAGAVAASTGGLAEASACAGLLPLQHAGRLQPCADEVLAAATSEQGKHLRKAVSTLAESREHCAASIDKATEWGCKALSDLAYDFFSQALVLLQVCQSSPADRCDDRGRVAAAAQLSAWRAAELRFMNSPAEKLVTDKLTAMREDLLSALAKGDWVGEGPEALPPSWHVASRVVDKLKHWVSAYIWRETHWLWLQDSLLAGRVVQTAWGPADDWLRFGVHDAHADAPLGPFAPLYTFSERLGMRWEILVGLLGELHQRRGGEQLLAVEIGVFAGQLSGALLRGCGFLHLLGVDPYLGRDGTFPGNFSRTLDADAALYRAASVMEPFGDRAELWPMTSEAAAGQLEDGTVDAVFIDGCHLYDCVKKDFELWMPKMRRGREVLISGHDFSPQWPGVVQAVHEQRAGGHEVNLSTDWMYWWFEERS
uniref:Methyltransferase domain-containing protein n=1 Tax=Alexandrium monilatum TaxID=311494 RepID=A0A7S4PVN0_9DINO